MMAECTLVCQRSLGKRVTTYPQLATVIGGRKLGSLVSLIVCLTQLGVCCVMINFVATNLLAILPCETESTLIMNPRDETIKILVEPRCFGREELSAKRFLIALIIPIFIGLSWLPSIKALAPLAKVANYFMMLTILLVLFYAARSYYYVGLATSVVTWPPSTHSYLMFVGNCFYSFEGVATMVPLCAAMEDQGSMKKVLGKALGCILVLQLTIAVTCYVSFQDINSGSITAVMVTTLTTPARRARAKQPHLCLRHLVLCAGCEPTDQHLPACRSNA